MFFPVALFLGARVYNDMLVATYAPFMTPASFMSHTVRMVAGVPVGTPRKVEIVGVPNIAGV